MEEYIKRETVLNIVYDFLKANENTLGYLPEKSSIYHILKTLSPADVKPEQHGKWIEHHGQSYLVHPMKYDETGPVLQDYISYECSECGRTESKKEPYCHCGAKMDGGKNNDK